MASQTEIKNPKIIKPRKKTHKVYYGFYEKGYELGKKGRHYPLIRIAGNYLREFGFEIGSAIEVTMKNDEIHIKRVRSE